MLGTGRSECSQVGKEGHLKRSMRRLTYTYKKRKVKGMQEIRQGEEGLCDTRAEQNEDFV